MGGGAKKPPFNVGFGLFLLFSASFDQATDRTAASILKVDDSNDVFWREKVPFGGQVIT
jgi:hypothetical protein